MVQAAPACRYGSHHVSDSPHRSGAGRRLRPRYRARRHSQGPRAGENSAALHYRSERRSHRCGCLCEWGDHRRKSPLSVAPCGLATWRNGASRSSALRAAIAWLGSWQGFSKQLRFEDMRIPLGVVATDLRAGKPISFRDTGEVTPAIRASCSYPGLYRPFELNGRTYVDGAITVEVPAHLARLMGATHVIAACIPNQDETAFSRTTCSRSSAAASRS